MATGETLAREKELEDPCVWMQGMQPPRRAHPAGGLAAYSLSGCSRLQQNENARNGITLFN